MVTIDSSNSSLITVDNFNIIDDNGRLIQSIDSLTNLTSIKGSYAAAFTPPSESFTLQLQGMDQYGYQFSHFFDTSVEVSSIFWILSKLLVLVSNGLKN